MKKNFFTVIELLCVIGIITLLASLLVPAVGGAIEKSKVARAKSEISSIKTAVSSFYGQYGYFPDGIDNGEISSERDFIACLCCSGESGSTGTDRSSIYRYNPRRIQFLEWAGTELKDPWGGTYQVFVDSDRDGVINKSATKADSDVYTDVVVYSYGEDGKSAPTSDWIKSWE